MTDEAKGTIQFETDTEGREVAGIIKGVDRNGRGFEIRDFEHITNSAHEMGCVASMIAGGYCIEFTPTQVIALGFFLLKCGGAADGWPSPEDVQKLLQREYPLLSSRNGRFLADKATVIANAQLGQKLVETLMERDQLKRNADDLQSQWARMIIGALESIPQTTLIEIDSRTKRKAFQIIEAIRNGTEEGETFVQSAYIAAFDDMRRKLARNPTIVRSLNDLTIEWEPQKPWGKVARIGNILAQTTKCQTGRWRAMANNACLSRLGVAFKELEDLPDEATAEATVIRFIREFLEDDAAAIANTLDTLRTLGAG